MTFSQNHRRESKNVPPLGRVSLYSSFSESGAQTALRGWPSWSSSCCRAGAGLRKRSRKVSWGRACDLSCRCFRVWSLGWAEGPSEGRKGSHQRRVAVRGPGPPGTPRAPQCAAAHGPGCTRTRAMCLSLLFAFKTSRVADSPPGPDRDWFFLVFLFAPISFKFIPYQYHSTLCHAR